MVTSPKFLDAIKCNSKHSGIAAYRSMVAMNVSIAEFGALYNTKFNLKNGVV
jgi:hypothetical protein